MRVDFRRCVVCFCLKHALCLDPHLHPLLEGYGRVIDRLGFYFPEPAGADNAACKRPIGAYR